MNADVTLAVLKRDLDAQTDSINRILRHLEGNGSDGLIVRVDRLEQSEERRKWAVRALAGAIAGVAAKAFWGVF